MSDIVVDGKKMLKTDPLSNASMLSRVRRPRQLKRVLAALRATMWPLTAADLGALCDLTSCTAARSVRTLKNHGYPIHIHHRKNPRVTEYQLVAEIPTQRD